MLNKKDEVGKILAAALATTAPGAAAAVGIATLVAPATASAQISPGDYTGTTAGLGGKTITIGVVPDTFGTDHEKFQLDGPTAPGQPYTVTLKDPVTGQKQSVTAVYDAKCGCTNYTPGTIAEPKPKTPTTTSNSDADATAKAAAAAKASADQQQKQKQEQKQTQDQVTKQDNDQKVAVAGNNSSYNSSYNVTYVAPINPGAMMAPVQDKCGSVHGLDTGGLSVGIFSGKGPTFSNQDPTKTLQGTDGDKPTKYNKVVIESTEDCMKPVYQIQRMTASATLAMQAWQAHAPCATTTMFNATATWNTMDMDTQKTIQGGLMGIYNTMYEKDCKAPEPAQLPPPSVMAPPPPPAAMAPPLAPPTEEKKKVVKKIIHHHQQGCKSTVLCGIDKISKDPKALAEVRAKLGLGPVTPKTPAAKAAVAAPAHN